MVATVAERSASTEFRFDAASRVLTGDVVNYGRAAVVAGVGLERFAPGSLIPRDDIGLNLFHGRDATFAHTGDGSLRLHDSDTELRIEADVLERSAAWWALTRKVARSLSVEFASIEEHRDGNGVRTITKASLNGIGLVDASPHRGRVELRHIDELRAAAVAATLTSIIPSATRLRCECSGRECHWALFSDAALDDMAAQITGNASETLATWSSYDRPLGSSSMGRVRAERTAAGLVVAIDIPATGDGEALLDAAETSGIVVRPFLDAAESDSAIEGAGEDAVRRYRSATVRSLVVSATDAREGWDRPVIERLGDPGLRHDRFTERDDWARRLLWP